jgi:hypothetical protein
MPLTSEQANAYVRRVKSQFDGIGVKNGTSMPPSKDSNTDPIVWELYVVQLLEGLLKARKEKAMEALVSNDIIQDHKAEPYPPGTELAAYVGYNCQVFVKVNKESSRFDRAALKGVLIRHKISPKVATTIEKECMKPAIPATSIRAIPLINDE